MNYISIFDNIIFIEESIEETSSSINQLGFIEYKKDKLYNNQLQNLNDVKKQLSEKAKKLGANAIINFKYGQKSTTWWRSFILAFDDNVNWYGSGIAVKLNDELYIKYINKIKAI